MRYGLLVLLVAGLVAAAGYTVMQPLQTAPQAVTTSTLNTPIQSQAASEAIQQTAVRTVLLDIAMDGAVFKPGSTVHLTASIKNTGPEEVLLEYFIGQLFEIIIRDETGTRVYVHSDTNYYKHLMAAPLHLMLAPGESHTETIEIKLSYSRGVEKDTPLTPGAYTLTVYLTAAVQNHPSGTIDGIRAHTSASKTITVSPQ